jgi:putative ABC transport system permease protein
MKNIWQDLRYGARMFLKQSGFVLIAVLTLALGIGANTAIFSLVNAVLIKPLPFSEPERLVLVWEDRTATGTPKSDVAPANYADWGAQQSVFEEIAALKWQGFDLNGDSEPEKIVAFGITANFFPMLGVRPLLGRNFTDEEDKPGAGKAVILSYSLWQRRYGGEPGILGREILLDREKYTVVGVMPANFQFMQGYIGLWFPAAFSKEELTNRDSSYLTIVARMKRGVTIEQAQADILTITRRIARDYPKTAAGLGAAVVTLREQLSGRTRKPLLVLLVAVVFVLLIACANLASLLLARAATRRREIAVRAALGASRARIVQQLLTESVMLAGIGGAAGLLIAAWSFTFLKRLIPPEMTLSTQLELDVPALGYALLLSLLTGIVFGLAPALQASKLDLNQALKGAGGNTALAAGGNRLRGAFVVAEMALALALLFGAGLLMRSVYNLFNQYSALQPEKLLTVRTAGNAYGEHHRRTAFYDQVLDHVNSLPGVISAGYTTSVPLQWKGGMSKLAIEGKQPVPGATYNAVHRQVSTAYLQTMKIGIRRGRYFEESDGSQTLPVAIINETMARQYWPDEDPLGKRFKLEPGSGPWLTIVGVVADVRQMGMDLPVQAEIYLSYRQIGSHQWFQPRDLVVRAAGDPQNLVAGVREAIRAADPDQPISNIATMAMLLGEEGGARRSGMMLISVFAGLALLLASMGIYGVLSYFVVQQTQEIGIRMALGAHRRDILSLVLRKGMEWTLFGAALGVAAGLALTRLMKSLLFGVSATDAVTFVAVSLFLIAVALLACLIPARRAAKVDPIVALRCE